MSMLRPARINSQSIVRTVRADSDGRITTSCNLESTAPRGRARITRGRYEGDLRGEGRLEPSSWIKFLRSRGVD